LSPDAPNASVINLLHGVNVESTPAQISTALAAGNLLRAQKRQADDASRPERTKENKRLKKLETVNEQIMKATTEKNQLREYESPVGSHAHQLNGDQTDRRGDQTDRVLGSQVE
jgi:hypothetical protein